MSLPPQRRAPRPSRRPVVLEYFTPTRRHLSLQEAHQTACGRRLTGMELHGEVRFPWQPPDGKGCQACRRVLASGSLGFYVTPRGGILTHEMIEALSREAEQGYDISRDPEPVMGPGHEPGPDAMRWYPNPLEAPDEGAFAAPRRSRRGTAP